MGDVKQNMQPTTEKTKSIFDRLRKRDKKVKAAKSDDEIATTFVDHIALANEKIDQLIASKQKDVVNEKGQTEQNKQKLRLLTRMENHLEMIVDLAQEYGE